MKKLLSVLLALALVITAIPMVIAGAEDNGDVVINADGRKFSAKTGDTFDYIYCLNIGERLCSLQGDFYYDADGLELIIPENDEDLTFEMIFPKLWSAVIFNELEKGHILYNYSGANGTKFATDTSQLIRAQFKVTATSGELAVTNILHTLAGENERAFLYIDEVIEPLPYSGSDIPALTPIEVAPTTQPETEHPTVESTDPDVPVPERKYGDVDDDGDITIVDTSFIQRHLAGINVFDEVQLKYGDVDGDGEVTIVDGTYIQRWIAGIVKDNPMERFGYPRA